MLNTIIKQSQKTQPTWSYLPVIKLYSNERASVFMRAIQKPATENSCEGVTDQ